MILINIISIKKNPEIMKQMKLKSFIYLLAISEVILAKNVNTSNLPIAIYLQKTII